MVKTSSANHLEMVFQWMDFSCSPTKYFLNLYFMKQFLSPLIFYWAVVRSWSEESERRHRLCLNRQQGLLQGEWDTDIVRKARKAVQRGEEGKRPCQTGTCQGEGDSDGGVIRHAERALRPQASQGPDEVDGNPVHLLRHPHSKRGAAGRQDRAESTAGSLLKRKYAHRKVLSRGNYASVIANRQIIRPKRPDWDIKT